MKTCDGCEERGDRCPKKDIAKHQRASKHAVVHRRRKGEWFTYDWRKKAWVGGWVVGVPEHPDYTDCCSDFSCCAAPAREEPTCE